jgi:hypothetical protein
MRRLVIASAIVAVLLGVLALLLADDVRSWNRTLAGAPIAYDAHRDAVLQLTAPTVLPAGISGDILGVGTEQKWLTGLQRFNRVYQGTRHLDLLDPKAYKSLNGAEAVLTKLAQDPNPARASQAYDLLGILVFREATPGTGNVVRSLVQKALIDLENAVRLDPANEAARENIELLLGFVNLAIPPEQQQSRGLGLHTGTYPKGGYAGPPGEGF